MLYTSNEFNKAMNSTKREDLDGNIRKGEWKKFKAK